MITSRSLLWDIITFLCLIEKLVSEQHADYDEPPTRGAGSLVLLFICLYLQDYKQLHTLYHTMC